jgi:hypothetical protein
MTGSSSNVVLVFPAIPTLTTFFSALSWTVSLAQYHYGRSQMYTILLA